MTQSLTINWVGSCGKAVSDEWFHYISWRATWIVYSVIILLRHITPFPHRFTTAGTYSLHYSVMHYSTYNSSNLINNSVGQCSQSKDWTKKIEFDMELAGTNWTFISAIDVISRILAMFLCFEIYV